MATFLFTRRCALALAFTALSAGGAQAAGTYFNLGAGVTPSGSSANGSVVGAYRTAGLFYMWTPVAGVVSIGGNWSAGNAGVSDDGSRISGSALGSNGLTQAAYYSVASSSWTTLGGIGGASGGQASSGWGISGDGRSVVGLGWVNAGSAHAVQSTSAGTLLDLGSSGGSSRANGVNQNGSVVVGWSDRSDGYRQGAYWKNGALTLLASGNGNALPEAGDVSADGTWIVGSGGTGVETWRYNTLTGATQFLGDYNAANNVQAATGISADGRVIVGYDRAFGPATFGEGTVWIEGQGLQSLTTYVTAQGVNLNGRSLALPLGVSGDGSTFFGLDNTGAGFVVTLAPVPEPASWAMLALGLVGLTALARRRGTAGR